MSVGSLPTRKRSCSMMACGDGGFLAGDGAFAEAYQAVIGVDLAEDPVEAAGVHHERFQPGDLQVQGPCPRRGQQPRTRRCSQKVATLHGCS